MVRPSALLVVILLTGAGALPLPATAGETGHWRIAPAPARVPAARENTPPTIAARACCRADDAPTRAALLQILLLALLAATARRPPTPFAAALVFGLVVALAVNGGRITVLILAALSTPTAPTGLWPGLAAAAALLAGALPALAWSRRPPSSTASSFTTHPRTPSC